MFKHQTLFIASFTLFSLTTVSFAAESVPAPVKNNAIQETLGLVSEFQHGNVGGLTQKALDIIVAEGTANLRDSGETAIADQLETEWNTDPTLRRSLDPQTSSGEMSTLDLGDHRPLSAWLLGFYDKLNAKTNGMFKNIRILKDINTLNYAIPVVINPSDKGHFWKGEEGRNYIEYRKHFIPFANIVTYWGNYEGCKYLLTHTAHMSKGVSRLCNMVAGKLEHYMGRRVAPKMSDWIYSKTNGGKLSTMGNSESVELPVVSEQDLDAVLSGINWAE